MTNPFNEPQLTQYVPVQAQTSSGLARPQLPWVWLALPIQMAVGLIVMTPLWIYIHLSLTVTYDGVLTLIGFTVMTVLAPWITVCAAALFGLPIRLIPALRRWWTSNGEVGLAGVVIGYGLVLAGSFSRHRETGVVDGVPYDVLSPDMGLLFAGWLVFGFFIVNTWIPLRWYGRRGQTNTAPSPRQRALRKP
ncbi:hypothetical protein ACIPY0_08455 [Paenarthrobacter nicotinovorans]|uniref:hypothetical protein n=1 Tax=Paenarthrobacter nicotinovorans TaxID=29320 RepID=UPI0037F17807